MEEKEPLPPQLKQMESWPKFSSPNTLGIPKLNPAAPDGTMANSQVHHVMFPDATSFQLFQLFWLLPSWTAKDLV